MPHLVAAPDKLKGTATASGVAAAAAAGARRAGWTCQEVPMADGGEGLLDVVGGQAQRQVVSGPLDQPVEAVWKLLPETSTAVIEMAQAAGLVLAGERHGNDPLRATTTGVGELVLAAVEAGARRVVVGCGGSATTDGGVGAIEAVEAGGGRRRLEGVDLVVAVDVTTPFADAATVFAPQKGADPDQVAVLTRRLQRLEREYQERFGVDVSAISGAGAAGGLAGGLVALGGRIVPGFDLVAELTGLSSSLEGADAVMTGEGRLDATSFAGKVVGGVLAASPPGVPLLCVVGEVDASAQVTLDGLGARVRVVSLVERFGRARALEEATEVVGEAVAELLSGWGAGGSGA